MARSRGCGVLPVVETQAQTIDVFTVGAFKMGAQIFDREDANVEISTEDEDNFIKNLVTIRAEERLALAVYRPQAFIKGTFVDRAGCSANRRGNSTNANPMELNHASQSARHDAHLFGEGRQHPAG
jgi:hypothetical protein